MFYTIYASSQELQAHSNGNKSFTELQVMLVNPGRSWLRLAAEKALCRALTHVMRSMWNCAANRVPSLSGSYDM